jgi:hypothetical protein
VFKELIENREKAAMRIYLGTDAALGSVGGAPGVDISALFGISTTKVQGDFSCISSALNTGVYQPWTATNYGDSRYAPGHEYEMPDPDQDKRAASYRARLAGFFEAVEKYRSNGFVIDQQVIVNLAQQYRVDAPDLAKSNPPSFTLAPTDNAKALRMSEIRAALGQDPFGDERDAMTSTEFDKYLDAKYAPKPAAPTPPPSA